MICLMNFVISDKSNANLCIAFIAYNVFNQDNER